MAKKVDKTKVLVLHAGFEGTDLVLDELIDQEVILSSLAFGNLARPAALRKLAISADVAVGVLPSAPARGRSSVVFQVGVAIGAGLPVLLIAANDRLGPELRNLPRLSPESLGALPQALEGLSASLNKASVGSPAEHLEYAGLSSSFKSEDRLSVKEPVQASTSYSRSPEYILEDLADAFRRGGARVQSAVAKTKQTPDSLIPDIVVWHDEILASVGLPLPVELISSISVMPKIRRRLKQSLKSLGGRSLLVVTAAQSSPTIQYVDDGVLLSVSADDLLNKLARFSVAEALATVMQEAR